MAQVRFLLIGAIAACLAGPAHAQYLDFGSIYPGATMVNMSEIHAQVENQGVDEAIVGQPPEARPENRFNPAYKPDQNRTSQNLATFVERTKSIDPAEARNLEALFAAQPDIVELIGAEMRQYGLDPHNVADAYALWWMSTWLAANQRHDTPDSAVIASVRDQARAAFASTADFAQTSDADRQQYAEALMIQTGLMDAAMEQAKGQPDVLAKLSQAAKQGALASGLDLNTMVLTENGFVPRQGADASGAVGNDAPALAQADEGSAATVVAIAAALGLGLGGAFWLGKRSG